MGRLPVAAGDEPCHHADAPARDADGGGEPHVRARAAGGARARSRARLRRRRCGRGGPRPPRRPSCPTWNASSPPCGRATRTRTPTWRA
jgi:hypothetical protein